MAYVGELVKMENGRWARFARCRVNGSEVADILVAVELEERYQKLLASAENSIDVYRQRGMPFTVRMESDEKGEMSVSLLESNSASVH
jgi:hypothetical protein